MSIDYGHEDRWPANTWINLWIDTYNRPPLLATELRPVLEKLGLDVLDPEKGLVGIFGSSMIEWNPETEVGRSMVLVRDKTGMMTKAKLLVELDKAPWTPKSQGPHQPSLSYWPSLPDATRDNQDTIDALWLAQRGGEGTVDLLENAGMLIKIGLFAAAGIALYGLWVRFVPDSGTRGKRRKRT